MKKIQEVVGDIQEKISEKSNDNIFLEYSQFGYIESVKLHIYMYQMDIEVSLWNSENEEREWIEEINDYEDFEVFLKRKVQDCLHAFTELRSILNEKETN